MKPIALTLALIGCHPLADSGSATEGAGTTPRSNAAAMDSGSRFSSAPALELASAEPPHGGLVSNGMQHTMEVPLLHCTSSAYNAFTMWSDESSSSDDSTMFDVHRMVIAQQGDRIVASVETGHPHDPTQVTRSNQHLLSRSEVTDTDLYFEWHGVWIYGWKSESEAVFNGGALGELDRPTLGTEATPAPPCGFEVELTCWDPNNASPEFTYNTDTGTCTNMHGEEGFNYRSVSFIRDTKDGECTDLSWAVLNEYVGFDSDLSGWNLRGARLDNAALSHTAPGDDDAVFVMLSDAALEGADLTTLEVGTGIIEGSIDQHTKLPNIACTVSDGRADCEG